MSSQTLAAALVWLERRIAGDPAIDAALFARLDAEQRKLGLLHGDRVVCPFLRPLVLERARMARIDPGYDYACVTSRLDAYLDGDEFQFLEYNAENPAGIADQSQLERVLFTLPHMREFLARYAHWLPRPHARLLKTLLEVYR
jgi:hypothetical protein